MGMKAPKPTGEREGAGIDLISRLKALEARGEDLPPDFEVMTEQIYVALQACPKGRIPPPLMIPGFSIAPELGLSPEQIILSFLETVARNPYLANNGIIVCFDTTDAGRCFGIARKEDHSFWLSEAAKQHLNTRNITTYAVPKYLAELKKLTSPRQRFDQ